MNIVNEGGINVPVFKGPISLAPVQKFLKERKEYQHRVTEYNNGQVPNRRIKEVSLPLLLDPDVLKIMADDYIDGIAVQDVTEQQIEDAFQKIIDKYSAYALRDWNVIFKDVRMKMDSEDPIERVSNFRLKYEKAVRLHALENELKEDSKFKLVVEDHLMKGLVPRGLTVRMEDLCKYDKKLKKDKIYFFQKLEEQAIQEKRSFDVRRTVESAPSKPKKNLMINLVTSRRIIRNILRDPSWRRER
jgi:hypothetical protein